MLVSRLSNCKLKHLRRLARYMRIKRWYRLRRAELIEELSWEMDPWR